MLPSVEKISRKSKHEEKSPIDHSPVSSPLEKFGRENVRHLKRISYSNSFKSPQYKIFPGLFTHQKTPSPKKIIRVEIHPKHNPPSQINSSVYFKITNTIRKQQKNFIAYRHLPKDSGCHFAPQGIFI